MKKGSLKGLLKRVQKDLDWPVLEQAHQMPMVRIVSYPRNKSHIILKPEPGLNQSSDLDVLHELGHATLCEKVHPVFSANSRFAPQENKRQFLMVIPALNAATDWFVGDWQMEVCPALLRDQIQESLPVVEEILGQQTVPPLEIILDDSLVIAQAVHYLKEPIECEGVLKSAVDAFLSVSPEHPSAEGCTSLVNRLMATYTDQRARLVNDGDYFVWGVYQPAAHEHAGLLANNRGGNS